MEENILYYKTKKTVDCPFGLKEGSKDFSFNKPTLLSLIPVNIREKFLNGL